tara:strand:- start:7106 stop:8098 length:993 start_codon:yes stop_codon:yes gene_type:complete
MSDDQNNKNIDDLKKKVNRQAEDLSKKANEEANKMMSKAKEEAEEMISKAKEEADEMMSKAKEEVDEMMSEAKEEADEMMSEAKEESKDIFKDNIKDQFKTAGSGSAFSTVNPLILKIKLIIAGVVILGSYIGLCFVFPQLNPFARKPFQLKETAVIIEESKKIAKLFSANYYAEVVIDTTKVLYETKTAYTNTIGNIFTSDENDKSTEYIDSTLHQITIIGNGTSYAANDLSKITSDDIVINDSICTININRSEIVNTVINPSDFTFFIDEGNWSPKEVQALKTLAVKKVENLATNNKILEKTDKRTKTLLKEYLKSIGFSVINVNFKE